MQTPQSSTKHLLAILAVTQPEWAGGSLCKLEGGFPKLCLFFLLIGFLYGITQEKPRLLEKKHNSKLSAS